MTSLAIVQLAPHMLDKVASVALAAEQVQCAAGKGAQLVVFPEAFIAGYPAWIWRLRPGADWSLCEAIHARFLDQAVDLSGDDLTPLCQAAAQHKVTVVCGMNERVGGTLYNSLITIDHLGAIVNHHRKLMPTNPERMVWGGGDGQGLKVIDTPVGKIGGLICWENYMPLARYALYAQGVELFLAPTYDSGSGWIGSMQHIAREGRCWVASCGVALERSDLPADLPGLDQLYPADETWINPGDSLLVAPGGDIVAGPLHQTKECLLVEIDTAKALTSRRALDVAGHYARPDVFHFEVDGRRQMPVQFKR